VRLRSDHVAGGAVILAAAVVLALSGDLPTGRLSMPGAGMLPKLLCGFATVFGLVLLLRGRGSVPLSQIDWSDLRHAAPVIVITVLAVSFYTTLGFLVTMTGLLFALLQFERCRLLPSVAYSIGISTATYALFVHVLKSPLERGLIAF
jgi:hypothetical protein